VQSRGSSNRAKLIAGQV